MPSQIIVFRTNTKSSYWESVLKDLSTVYDIVIVCDERNGSIGFNDFKKIQFNIDNIDKIGLNVYDDMCWRCGDYALYLTNYNFEDYDYMWLVEPDVYFNDFDFKKLIMGLKEYNTDFLSTYISEADDFWYWSKYKNSLDEEKVFKCFFPLIRISKNAVNFLIQERIKLNTMANDECFVATKLINNSFSFDVFSNIFPINYNSNVFSYKFPFYVKWINRNGCDIYHPVFFSFFGFLKHVYYKSSWKHFIKRMIGLNKDDF